MSQPDHAPAIEINCDMGESYGIYRLGDDAAVLPFIHSANVACGFHAGDPTVIARTVRLAKAAGVKIGAHPSLPDRDGFGRREMRLGRAELRDALVYQIGALAGFLRAEELELSHLKVHGVLYGMALRDAEVCEAICDAAEVFELPVYGMAGTLHESVAAERGRPFWREFFGDLEYDGAGRLIITREHPPVDPDYAARRIVRAMREGKVQSTEGSDLAVSFDTICIHSDTPNIIDLARAIRAALDAG